MRFPGLKERVRRLFYPAYEARMVKALPKNRIPRHIGVMLDGNRRWAKGVQLDSTQGYRAGAANIEPLLEWSEEVGVQVVTLWLLSTDNLSDRPMAELEGLLHVIGDAVEALAEQRRWRLHPVGALDLLPSALATRLKEAEESTR
ncbi:MAG TPA: undecaprenyl diphosphate synthase family protein, partial [Nocardioides sp.]|nr:undecaprenyl diphosphate synthase family protein [Nocardioides sp.]